MGFIIHISVYKKCQHKFMEKFEINQTLLSLWIFIFVPDFSIKKATVSILDIWFFKEYFNKYLKKNEIIELNWLHEFWFSLFLISALKKQHLQSYDLELNFFYGLMNKYLYNKKGN